MLQLHLGFVDWKKLDFGDSAEEICRNSQRFSQFVWNFLAKQQVDGPNFRHPAICRFFSIAAKTIQSTRCARTEIDRISQKSADALWSVRGNRAPQPIWPYVYTYIIIYIMRCTLEYTSLAHSKLSSASAHSWNQSLGRERKRRGLFGCFGVWPAYACGARTTIRGWWRPRRMSQSVGAQRSLCAPGKLLYNERRTRHRSNYSAAAFVLQCGSIICECGWVMGRLVRWK